MPALLAGHSVLLAPSLGMDHQRVPDAQPIFDQFLDMLTGVGIGDFTGLIEVLSALLFATEEDTGSKPPLKSEHTHGCSHSGERKDRHLLNFVPKSFGNDPCRH